MVLNELTDVAVITRALGLAQAAADSGGDMFVFIDDHLTQIACLSAALGLALRNLPTDMVDDAATGSIGLVRLLVFGQPLHRSAHPC